MLPNSIDHLNINTVWIFPHNNQNHLLIQIIQAIITLQITTSINIPHNNINLNHRSIIAIHNISNHILTVIQAKTSYRKETTIWVWTCKVLDLHMEQEVWEDILMLIVKSHIKHWINIKHNQERNCSIKSLIEKFIN